MSRIRMLIERIFLFVTLIIYYFIPVIWGHLRGLKNKRDIRVTYQGESQFASGRYAILVIWQPQDIPWYVRTLLTALKRHQINVVLVANHPIPAHQIDFLKQYTFEIIIRGNLGFDFGAYKDAILHILDREDLTRLLILNDSVYYFEQGLDHLITSLIDPDYEVVSAFENWQIHFHFQSFCLGIASDVMRHATIKDFWHNYTPVSNRRWCIHGGEVGLTRALLKAATRFKVVYEVNDLINILREVEPATLFNYREFVPVDLRQLYPCAKKFDFKQTNTAWKYLTHEDMLRKIGEVVTWRSQIHSGAFFYPKYLSAPIMKRDLVYRLQFTLYELERMLVELQIHEHRESIVNDMRRRGSSAHLRGFKRRRASIGII